MSADQLDLPQAFISKGVGPRAALMKLGLQAKSPSEKIVWVEDARMRSILGSCKLSLPSVMSGLRCWVAFIGMCVCGCMHCSCGSVFCRAFADVLRPHRKIYFPPELEMLQAWSELFRSSLTFSNYLGYVRTGCMIVRAGHSVQLGLVGVCCIRCLVCSTCRC